MLSRRYVNSFDNACFLRFLHSMIPNANVFGAFMHLRAADKANAQSIVEVEQHQCRDRTTYFAKKVLEPNDLACGYLCSYILSLGGACGSYSLFLKAPHNRTTIKKFNIADS